ncbi:hypothetical protein COO60DRAFT_387304 [Scenedesmus sp. NREL 46B-D3]|nr:hypothetical protein COO60DRAFT_387304 [Scenedesmus sp. NREL 46B-D3]
MMLTSWGEVSLHCCRQHFHPCVLLWLWLMCIRNSDGVVVESSALYTIVCLLLDMLWCMLAFSQNTLYCYNPTCSCVQPVDCLPKCKQSLAQHMGSGLHGWFGAWPVAGSKACRSWGHGQMYEDVLVVLFAGGLCQLAVNPPLLFKERRCNASQLVCRVRCFKGEYIYIYCTRFGGHQAKHLLSQLLVAGKQQTASCHRGVGVVCTVPWLAAPVYSLSCFALLP